MSDLIRQIQDAQRNAGEAAVMKHALASGLVFQSEAEKLTAAGKAALAAIEADHAQRVPEGWALVPIEPTDKMVQACHHIDLSYMPGQEGADRAAIYRAMIAAAPQPVAQPSDVPETNFGNTQPKPEQAAQPVRDSLHDDIQSVLLEVEQAIGNGACPWQIEAAFEAYEAARRLQPPPTTESLHPQSQRTDHADRQ